MPGTSITNIQNDLEKKECEDIGKEKKHKFINLFGKIFSRLEVLEYSHTDNYGQRIWKCICNCGNLTYVSTNKLNNHHTQSCGCLHKEKLRLSVLKHGLSRTLGYRVWIAMMQRCYDKKHPNYKNYGSRGYQFVKNGINLKTFARYGSTKSG